MKRAAIKLAAFMIIAAMLVGVGQSVAARQAFSLDSGALGRFKSEIEADFGPSGDAIDMPGHPIYDDTYAYETQAGTLYVSYREINGETIATYVEFQWRGDGVDEVAAQKLVKDLIPVDATLTALYTAPPTSSGPTALVANEYDSKSLGQNPALAPEFLVIYQQSWSEDAAPIVHAVSISIRERTQATDS